MENYILGIIKGLEIAYKMIDREDPDNKNLDLISTKLCLIQTIKKWKDLGTSKELTLGEVREIEDINKLDDVDKAILILDKICLIEKEKKQIGDINKDDE